jgi:hypothetical protein
MLCLHERLCTYVSMELGGGTGGTWDWVGCEREGPGEDEEDEEDEEEEEEEEEEA